MTKIMFVYDSDTYRQSGNHKGCTDIFEGMK
ncbi:Uncharacterised protein [uncultured Ruminococcus sp.]|jgi:hypothetical protein|nr:Uncharacterised protein [uncultured Ruminococcus sp.]